MDTPPGRSPAPVRSSAAPQFVGFRLGPQHYAFPIGQIREIVIPTAVASLPDVAGSVDGVANLRGAIIPIVNLRPLLGLPRRPLDADSRTVVVTVGPRIMGCLVDSVTRVMRIASDQIQPVPETVAAAGRSAVAGFVRIGAELCILLDVEQLLDPAHLDHPVSIGAE